MIELNQNNTTKKKGEHKVLSLTFLNEQAYTIGCIKVRVTS